MNLTHYIRTHREVVLVAGYIIVAAVLGYVSIAFATLTFTGTALTSDGTLTIDSNGALTLGNANATAITIGRDGLTGSLLGNITIGTSTAVSGAVLTLGTTTNMFTVLSNGNVGIGTTLPTGRFDVTGGEVNFSPNTANKNTFKFTTDITDMGRFDIKANTAVMVSLNTNGNSYLIGGNVGIGTSVPDATLDVSGGTGILIRSSSNQGLVLTTAVGDARSATISFKKSRGFYSFPEDALNGDSIAEIWSLPYSTSYKSLLSFQTAIDGTFTTNQNPPTRIGLYTNTANGAAIERLRINSSGNVGIGTVSPGSRLEIKNTASADDVLLLEDSSGLCEAQPSTTGLTWSCSSDIRLKANVRNASDVLDYVVGIPLKDYTVIKTGENATGPIAQDLLVGYKELVREGDDGYYQVSELSQWKLVKAIQELKAENAALKARLEALEAKVK